MDACQLEQSILMDIKDLSPEKKPNILLLGPVGAGKSSFINSCLSLGVGRKKALAKTGSAEKSYTLQFRPYTDSELLKDFRLLDCMGMEPKYGEGFHPNDVFFLLQGHIKKDYKFDPEKAMTKDSELYRKNPQFEHKTHCVVFVIDARTMHRGIQDAYVDQIKFLQDIIKKEDVPRVLVLTHVDKLCEEVRKDSSNIFRSLKLEKVMKFASEVFSIEMASIHPVTNYEDDFELYTEKNIPILLALRQIMQYASDRVEQVINDSGMPTPFDLPEKEVSGKEVSQKKVSRKEVSQKEVSRKDNDIREEIEDLKSLKLPVIEAQINAKKASNSKPLISDSGKHSIFDSCQVSDIIKEESLENKQHAANLGDIIQSLENKAKQLDGSYETMDVNHSPVTKQRNVTPSPSSSVKGQKWTVQIMNPTKNEKSRVFANALINTLKQKVKGVECKFPETSDQLDDRVPLIVVCPQVSRLQPDVDAAIESVQIQWTSPYVVIILHIGSERDLPALPSGKKLRGYNDVTFVDMGCNDYGEIIPCDHNTEAEALLRSHFEASNNQI